MIATDRDNIDKIAVSADDRILLAKLWDKIEAGMRRNIPVSTCFLSPREQEMAKYLFESAAGLCFFGGYEDAERRMLCYLPDYLEEDFLFEDGGPVTCLHATFYEGESLSHRDFLGGMIGCGVERDVLGDILVGAGCCDLFVATPMADFIQQNFLSAGRVKLKIEKIPLEQVRPASSKFIEIKDTVASPRLDSILSSGFRISRSAASQYISAEKVMVNGLPCTKPDRMIAEGASLSVRGLGKIKIHSVSGQTKKGRIWVVIHRYV